MARSEVHGKTDHAGWTRRSDRVGRPVVQLDFMKMRLLAAWRRQTLKRQQMAFFAVVTLIVLVLTGAVTVAGASYADVFAANLNRYLALHKLRSALSQAHYQLEQYALTGAASALEDFRQDVPRLDANFRNVADSAIINWQSRLEVRAIDRGLQAYKRAATQATRQYEDGETGYYIALDYAGRIAGYVDAYMERLFRIHLTEGTSQFQASLSRQHFVRVASFVGVVVIGALLISFAVVFSRVVATPLAHLSEMAHEMAAGNLDIPAVDIPPTRELQILADAFNTMNRNIRQLVADLRDKQELQARLHEQELTNERMQGALREAQLLALQAQMNPHFLFNTLNNIVRTARKEGADQSERLIRSLSSVLRYVLRSSGHTVTLGREMEIVAEYLHLQQVRFGSRLRFDLNIPEELKPARLPPLTIQPIVENAVMHGLEPQEEIGQVTVTVQNAEPATPRQLRIEIHDTGVGMSPELVASVFDEPAQEDEQATHGIGLRNVRRRLQLHFGENIGFDLCGKPGEGTTVTMQIPYVEVQVNELSYSHRG